MIETTRPKMIAQPCGRANCGRHGRGLELGVLWIVIDFDVEGTGAGRIKFIYG